MCRLRLSKFLAYRLPRIQIRRGCELALNNAMNLFSTSRLSLLCPPHVLSSSPLHEAHIFTYMVPVVPFSTLVSCFSLAPAPAMTPAFTPFKLPKQVTFSKIRGSALPLFFFCFFAKSFIVIHFFLLRQFNARMFHPFMRLYLAFCFGLAISCSRAPSYVLVNLFVFLPRLFHFLPSPPNNLVIISLE